MKLPIKKEYFDKIKSGEKEFEYRDAHITFICEETNERLMKQVIDVAMVERHSDLFPDVLEDDWVIRFKLKRCRK
jgi:uncharacterized radical SAM superfamily protein